MKQVHSKSPKWMNVAAKSHIPLQTGRAIDFQVLESCNFTQCIPGKPLYKEPGMLGRFSLWNQLVTSYSGLPGCIGLAIRLHNQQLSARGTCRVQVCDTAPLQVQSAKAGSKPSNSTTYEVCDLVVPKYMTVARFPIMHS